MKPIGRSMCAVRKGSPGCLRKPSRFYLYTSQVPHQRSGYRTTNISNNANVIIVEAYSLTEGREDWHLEASLNFWPFQG